MDEIQAHPVEEFLDYIWLTLGTHHYAAREGIRDVVSRLSATVPQANIHLSSPISSLRPDASDPRLASIHCDTATGEKVYSGFHHIIIATQANRAVPILQSYAEPLSSEPSSQHHRLVHRQLSCLRRFRYITSLVINHTDDSLLPDAPEDRRDLNLISPGTYSSFPEQTHIDNSEYPTRVLPPIYTMTTHSLSPPSQYPSHLPRIYQTTNPIIAPKEQRILSISVLERAVVTLESKAILDELHLEPDRRFWKTAGQTKSQLGPVQGAGRASDSRVPGIWLCGSYASSGIPLLEGCVVSARNVVEQGIWKAEGEVGDIPW